MSRPEPSLFVPARDTDADFRSAERLCFIMLLILKTIERQKPAGAAAFCLSHNILLNWPWHDCEPLKMRMTSSYTRQKVFTHREMLNMWSAVESVFKLFEFNYLKKKSLSAMSRFSSAFSKVAFNYVFEPSMGSDRGL